MRTPGDFISLVTLWSLILRLTTATIDCVCSTDDCRHDNQSMCMAEYMCYVQYTPNLEDHGSTPKEPVMRGCINTRTPLLCENRRPRHDGPWPVLLCCSDDLCNRDVLPTIPTWLQKIKNGKNHTNTDLGDSVVKDTPHDASGKHYIINSEDIGADIPKARNMTINPIYVAVPIAGTCVLLALIIFGIYILKRRHIQYENCYYDTGEHQQQSSVIPKEQFYQQNGHLLKQNGHLPKQNGHLLIQNGQPPPPSIVRTSSKSPTYSDTERSSSGSESKLLMKV
ncbi:unnamed protein product [Owenia fusiformis]|uniref:Activin types I and II receptor domain-containing protein n=1 Tax=Owenia fusiformis TaxID=6347 RepID=A0A8S4PAG5_OWEFU|nr:unnamed protein product [Owenia fusiformis]